MERLERQCLFCQLWIFAQVIINLEIQGEADARRVARARATTKNLSAIKLTFGRTFLMCRWEVRHGQSPLMGSY